MKKRSFQMLWLWKTIWGNSNWYWNCKNNQKVENTTICLKTDISEARKALTKDFFDKPDDSLTEEQEPEREAQLQARVNIVKQLMATYKSSHGDLIQLSPMKDQKH